MWDAELFDYASVYNADFEMDKAERLEYHQTAMTHAMLFTGVDVVDGKPRRWRVENSWDDKVGDKGFFLMNDSWFAEYMFEIAAPKSYLPEELQRALDTGADCAAAVGSHGVAGGGVTVSIRTFKI